MMLLMTSKGTKRKTIRIQDDLWFPAIAKAEREGTSVSAKVRDFLRRDLEEGES